MGGGTMTSGTREGRCRGDRVQCMNRLELDVLAGAFVTVVSIVVGLPVLLAAPDGMAVPVWVWAGIYLGYLVAQVIAMWCAESLSRTRVLAAVVVLCVLGPVLVWTAPTAGWLPILLIFTAAIAATTVELWSTAAIVLGNTVVIGLAAWSISTTVTQPVLVALIYCALQIASVASVLSQNRQERIRRRLTAAHVELRTASALLADASRTDERVRISRELHDLLGHQLTALTLELEVASHRTEPPARDHVLRAQSIARELLGDVRSAVGELRRHAPDLSRALARIVDDIPELTVRTAIADTVEPDEKATAVLIRCVQEIVTNTIRHSGATELWIDIDAEDGVITLQAHDNGNAAEKLIAGHGLIGMSERVHSAGGTLEHWIDGSVHLRATVPVGAVSVR
ncbi:hypothetical protein CH300_08320 [Rhodococcus sp. 15-1154-1]|nr:hypothetical protein CH300_08320 [Rhodococcus sp. 15-1154-1]